MSLFNRNIKKKHIEQFELKIAALLKDELPQFQKVIHMSKLHGISFTQAPKGIYISRSYDPDAHNEIQRNHRTHFNLTGISAYHLQKKSFIPLKLNYSFDSLTRIEVEEPEQFHKNFDLEKVQVNQIEIEQLPVENPDREIVEKILKALSSEQFEMLELDDTFKIELDEKLFYTILDMEDGNYITVNASGQVFRLNHDHVEQVKLIADSPGNFFDIYNGQKIELERFMHL